jgi:hypothetical protein
MDMFRMLQTLEREPQDDYNHIYDASPAPGRVPLVSADAILLHQKWPDWKFWMSKSEFISDLHHVMSLHDLDPFHFLTFSLCC